MPYYIIDKEKKERQYYGYDEGWVDEGISDYYYLVGVRSKKAATEFDDKASAVLAIIYSEGSLDDYVIVKEKA